MTSDLTELLKRIAEFAWAYRDSGYKAPLFRLTPYEHKLLRDHLINSAYFIPEYYGDLPNYLGANFELVGSPQLFAGMHVRSDTGIEITNAKIAIIQDDP
jgi:hypothetical protein